MYLFATKPINKWSKASGQSSKGLWVENRAEIWVFFFHLFQNCSIFQPFLLLCLFVNFCESGVYSYQFYSLLSTSSPILKYGVWEDHWFPLCYVHESKLKHILTYLLCNFIVFHVYMFIRTPHFFGTLEYPPSFKRPRSLFWKYVQEKTDICST